MSADLIYQSLEQAAETAGDITPECYEKFFSRSADSEALMMHMDDIQRHKMMEEVYRLIMVDDLASEAEYLNWEVNNHEIAYSVLPDMYDHLLLALKDTVAEVLDDAWNDDFEQAWRQQIDDLLGEIRPRFAS